MGATYWVYAGGVWRPLEVSSGRVRGWAGRAAFCVARRGRLQLLRAAAVLRGLRALQRQQPTTVRDGMPLPRRRPVKRPHSPVRCCCARARADVTNVRDAVDQLILSVQPKSQQTLQSTSQIPLQSTSVVGISNLSHPVAEKSDAAVQAGAGPRPPAPAPAPSRDSDNEPPACKELIVNEEDVMALRAFLERDPRNPFQVDLLRFDEDDDYKSALFYSINPLVAVERSARVAEMLRQRESQSLLREFAGSLGLRAVGPAPAPPPYRMRRRRGSDKENRRRSPSSDLTSLSTRPYKSTNRSPNKLANSANKWEYVTDTSDSSSGSDSSDVFQTRVRTLRKKRLAHERNTRSQIARLSSIRPKNDMSKQERDDDARSKYLVGKMKSKDIERLINEVSDSDGRGKDNDGEQRPKGKRNQNTRRDEISKVKERNDDSQSDNSRSEDREMSKSKEDRSRSKDTDRRKSLRPRNDSQRNLTTISNGSEAVIRNKTARDREVRSDIAQVGSSAESDASDAETSKSGSRANENRKKRQRNVEKYVESPSILGSKTRTQARNENSSKGSTGTTKSKKRSRDYHGRFAGDSPSKNSESRKSDEPKDGKRNDEVNPKDRDSSVDQSIELRTKKVDRSEPTANEQRSISRSPTKNTKGKSKDVNPRGLNPEDGSDSRGEKVWAERNGAGGGRPADEAERSNPRPRRSTVNVQPAEPLRREYSSLEDHAIVQWLSLGSRARRVNGNAVWRELQEQFARIAGRARSWHSLRNRYLRSILPALGTLALPPATVAALRAAQAKGELKSRRRAPRPNPLLALPRVRSAWAARPRARLTQDSVLPATSESEATSRTLRSSTQRPPSPQKPPPRPPSPQKQSSRTRSPHKSSRAATKSSREDQASPTYSEVTRRFAARQAVSTPEPRAAGSPPRKRRLYNPGARL